MAPLAAAWAKFLYVFDILTGSPGPSLASHDELGLQIPIISLPQTSQHPKFPIYDPPETVDPDFRCEYPGYLAKDGWVSCNTPENRGCWLRNEKTGQVFDINTDFEVNGPKGRDRPYSLELSESMLNPDDRKNGDVPVQLFNNLFPGPRLQACWGDELQVTIHNNLNRNVTAGIPGNGTTIHWHGFRMLNTSPMDGVNGVTQCPIAPGKSFTYVFNATQYGTSWYHSHYSLQYGAGALGAFTVYGPASANFTTQLDPIIITDWMHESPFERWERHLIHRSPVRPDNILVNGIGHWPSIDPSEVPATTRFHEMQFRRGAKYLIRLINGAMENTYIFSIDGHDFTIISTDFVPIKPYKTDHVVVGIGQRYNIIVEANPKSFDKGLNFWMRTTPANKCSVFTTDPPPDDMRGIVRYGQDRDIPKTSRSPFDLSCTDETYFNDPANQTLTPIVKRVVPKKTKRFDFYLQLPKRIEGTYPYYRCNDSSSLWSLKEDGASMWLNFSSPTILNPSEDFSQKTWLTVVDTGDTPEEEWIELVIWSGAKDKNRTKPQPLPKRPDALIPGQHPIHLHGHDFAVLDQCIPDDTHDCAWGNRYYVYDNPPRRDVAFLPNGGYLVIAFKADNPGAWIMHCHIAVHAGKGLAATVLENTKKWGTTFEPGWDTPFQEMCKAWDGWIIDNPSDPCMLDHPDRLPLQTDSGI